MKSTLIAATFFIVQIMAIGQTASEIAKSAIESTVTIIVLGKNMQPIGHGSGFVIDQGLIDENYEPPEME